MSQLAEVTDSDLDLIFNPLRHDFHCNVFLCGFETQGAEQAIDHMRKEYQAEIAQMDADLLALRLGLRPMIYPSVPVKLYRRPRGWWKF
jgi:hypothetical protein